MALKLRPHHIYCSFFLDIKYSDRKKEFQKADKRIKKTLRESKDATVEFEWGIDQMCEVCDYYDDKRGCTHPAGGEEEVQKWDHKILEELNVKIGDSFELEDLRQLVRESYPLTFCIERCPHRGECNPTSDRYL